MVVETHVVKKYSNRKLYDTRTKRYVTLDAIAEMLRVGDEVQVIDRTTGHDITAVTLSQILLDMERQRRGPIPEPLLVDMVKERGEQLLTMLRQSLHPARATIRRTVAGVETGAELIEHRVDEAVTTGLRSLGIAPAEELTALRRQVEELTARVDGLAEQVRRGRRGAGHE